MSSPHSPNQNRLLAALPTPEFERLLPQLELVSMRLGDLLCESGDELQHAYFPTSAIVSLHYVMEGGASVEVAGVGNEGMLGISLFMGGQTTLTRAIVQTAGHGYRLPRRRIGYFDTPASGRRRSRGRGNRPTQVISTLLCRSDRLGNRTRLGIGGGR